MSDASKRDGKPRRSVRPPARDHKLTLQPQFFPIAPHNDEDNERFEMNFCEEVLQRDPCNEDALILLGTAYTQRGEYEKGLAVDRRLVRLRPADPTAFYNLACSCALLRQVDEAIVALDRALALGYRDTTHLMTDPDMANLRKDPRFHALITRLLTLRSANS